MIGLEYQNIDPNAVSSWQRNKKKIILGVSSVVAIILIILMFVLIFHKRSTGEPDTNLVGRVTTANVLSHMQSLQNIANENNGTRAAGTTGYWESIQFIRRTLEDANTGYNITIQTFLFANAVELEPPALDLVSPRNISFKYNTDFLIMGAFNGKLDQQSIVSVVPNLGCEQADYATFTAGHIALIMRGVCPFQEKADLAAANNASAAIIYNDGANSDRMGVFNGGLGSVAVPVFSVSYGVGTLLSYVENAEIRMFAHSATYQNETYNIIADSREGDPDRVVVIGSHLDSVPAGPGINDNGSGSSLNLELALQLAKMQHEIKNKVRFCWFGAEELGLLGAYHYVEDLEKNDPEELARIVVNLNFDMIGSPNFFRGVYNGSELTRNNASGIVQRLFEEYFDSKNLTHEPTQIAIGARSDYGPFMLANISVGGLATGAEVLKTVEQRELYGGLANAAFDPCYHQSCDTFQNINQEVVGQMSSAAAHVAGTLIFQDDLLNYLQLSPSGR